jgi:hypothetical protein
MADTSGSDRRLSPQEEERQRVMAERVARREQMVRQRVAAQTGGSGAQEGHLGQAHRDREAVHIHPGFACRRRYSVGGHDLVRRQFGDFLQLNRIAPCQTSRAMPSRPGSAPPSHLPS